MGAGSSLGVPAAAGPFWVILPSARRLGDHRISFLGVPEGKVQRSDLAADVLSPVTGERRQSRALSSGLFPEQSPKDDFFQTPSFTQSGMLKSRLPGKQVWAEN